MASNENQRYRWRNKRSGFKRCVSVCFLCVSWGLRSVLALSSSSAKVSRLMDRAYASVKDKDVDKAFRLLSDVYKLDPNARGLSRLFEECLQLRIDSYPTESMEAHKERMGLSSIFLDQERYEEASFQLRQVVSSLSSTNSKSSKDEARINMLDKATSMLFRTNAACCHWDTYVKDAKQMLSLLDRSQDTLDKIQSVTPLLVHPFEALKWPCISFEMATRIASTQARRIVVTTAKDAEAAFNRFEFPPPRQTNVPRVRISKRQKATRNRKQIRIGYISPDFTSKHPLAFLMQDVFAHHDRSSFTVHLYSLTRDAGPEVEKIIKGSDTFTVLQPGSVSANDVAQQIKHDELDVLVDLCGYAGTSLVGEIMSCRPAPIQISYMGFPGSTGAPYLDYMVVDPIVVPEHLREHYTEHMIYMPHCYFVNSHVTCASQFLTSQERKNELRSKHNLPRDAFVFACHSRPDKIDPSTFRSWIRALVRVQSHLKAKHDSKHGSAVLWLLRSGGEMEQNLRNIAQKEFDLDPSFLVFADICPRDLHLERLGCADVFLDTPAYNAHTLGCDTLFAGVPMISLLRRPSDHHSKEKSVFVGTEKLPSRVGASLLEACGLSEFVCPTLDDYEDLMLQCATSADWFEKVASKLQEPYKSSLPLFDTRRWVRNLEVALREVVRRKEQKQGLADVIVEDAD